MRLLADSICQLFIHVINNLHEITLIQVTY
jgi:hypothetical protein